MRIKSRSGGIGRRPGLRIQFPKGSGGSSPPSCTNKSFLKIPLDIYFLRCIVKNKKQESFLLSNDKTQV